MNFTVAIIDNDEGIREAGQLLLECQGWTVQGYASAEAFLRHFCAGEVPDCVILELHLPGISGEALLAVLAANAIPAVVLTAWPENLTADRAATLGVTRVLTKPVVGERLVETLADIAERGCSAKLTR